MLSYLCVLGKEHALCLGCEKCDLNELYVAGGPGKAPFTAGGRIFMCGHWFYLVIISATYTGVLGPFLISSGASMVTGFSSLQMGHHTVVVRGPSWEDLVEEPKFKGSWRGGTIDESTGRSTQFKLLQNTMNTVRYAVEILCVRYLSLSMGAFHILKHDCGRIRRSSSISTPPGTWSRTRPLMASRLS